MKTHFSSLKKIILLSLGIFITSIKAQNSQWIFPSNSQYWNPTSGGTSLPTPTPIGTSYSTSKTYKDAYGLDISGPPNMYADASGNPLFFIVNGFVFNPNGYLIDTLIDAVYSYNGDRTTTPFKRRLIAGGWAEVCIVPVQGNCNQYFVFTAVDYGSSADPTFQSKYQNTFTDHEEVSYKPCYAVIDVSIPTPNAASGLGKNLSRTTPLAPTVVDLYSSTGTSGGVDPNAPYPGTIHYACSRLIGTGSTAYRFLYVYNYDELKVYKIVGTTIQFFQRYDLSDLTVDFDSDDWSQPVLAELEINEDIVNDKIHMALVIPHVEPGFGNKSNQLMLVDFTRSTGAMNTSSIQKICFSACSDFTEIISGVEFSPDGSYVYISRNATTTDPNTLESVSYATGAITAIATSGYGGSQIEAGIDGNLYISGTSDRILNPNAGPGCTLDLTHGYYGGSSSGPTYFNYGTTFGGGPSTGTWENTYVKFIAYMPDQIDGDIYDSPVTAGTSATICQGQSATLSVTGLTNFVWQPGGYTTSPVTVSPTVTTLYTVTGTTNVRACPVSLPVTITVLPGLTCCYTAANLNITQNITLQNGTVINPTSAGQIVSCYNSSGVLIPVTFYPTTTVNANINVPAGANVTISNTTFSFTPTSQFVVNTGNPFGGVVKFNKCTLTVNNVCESNVLWPGVTIVGNGSQPQGTLGTSQQGWVTMLNSQIDHAKTGVAVGLPFFNLGGGVLSATTSTFVDNLVGVDIAPYFNSAAVNKTQFIKCSFNTSTTFFTQPTWFAHLDHVLPRVAFAGTTFINSNSTYNWKYNGIQMNSSNVSVTQSGFTLSQFNKLYGGIYSSSTAAGPNLYCTLNKFTDNIIGVYIGTTDYCTINNNTFNVLDYGGPKYAYGLYIDNSTAFDCQGNTFKGSTGNTAIPYPYTFGIVANNTNLHASDENLIYKNTFTKLYQGTQTINKNSLPPPLPPYPQTPYNNRGLQLICNKFSPFFKSANIAVMTGDIDTHQGYPLTPTYGLNNQFSETYSTSSIYDYFYHANTTTNPGYSIQYWYNQSTLNGNPASHSIGYVSANPLPLFPVDQNAGCPTSPPWHITVNPYQNYPITIKQNLNQAKVLASNIDCGNTTNLLAVVNSNGISSTVRAQLLSCSPVISNDVLIAYVNNLAYSSTDKFQVLLSCSPLTDVVKNAVENSTLSQGNKSVLIHGNYHSGFSPFLAVENQVAELRANASYMVSDLIRLYLNDTITVGARDSALKYIKLVNGGGVPIKIGENIASKGVRVALAQDDTVGAALQYDTLLLQEGNSSNTQVHKILMQLHKKDIKATLQSNPAMVAQLTQIVADTNSHESRLLATWLLREVQPVAYQEEYQILTPNMANRMINENEENTTKIESPFKLGNYPNPFMQNTDITAYVPEGITNATLIVNDVLGREVAHYTLSEGNNIISFIPLNSEKGMLTYSLFIGDKKVDSQTMMKAGN